MSDQLTPEEIEAARAAAGQGPGAEQEPEPEPEESIAQAPPSVFEEIAAAQANADRERRKTVALLPGRFHGNLGVRFMPVDPKKRKRKVRKLGRRGITDEAELQYAAEVIVEATEAVVVDMGAGWVDAQTVPNSGLGEAPVKWDHRLAKILGPSFEDVLTGNEGEAAIVRLVFRNPEALEAFYIDLDLWLKEAQPDNEEDEDEDGADRPT